MVISRDLNKSVSLYFNLTYACNSACIFCASSSPNLKVRHDVPIECINEAFDRFQLGPNDEVILNGGEPTIYKGLLDVIRNASQRQAKVTLFTNGRLLRRYEFTRELLETGVFRLSVPLHGRFSETHDALTCRTGSLDETLAGIRNVYSIRALTGYPNQIELKLLTVRPALQEWPAIIEFIAQELEPPEILIMSGLHMWSTASVSYNQLTPTVSDMRQYVNRALDKAVAHNMNIGLWSIPLCMLNHEHLRRFAPSSCQSSSGYSDHVQAIYFDPDYLEGIELPNDETQDRSDINIICNNCELFESCGPGKVFLQQLLVVSDNDIVS